MELPQPVFDLFEGENLSGTTVSVIYDTHSSAWKIPLLLLRHAIRTGYFGIVFNYTGPLQAFMRKANAVGIDVDWSLREHEMAIVDLFGTRYGARNSLPNVFYLDKVEPDTLNPKIARIYGTYLRRALSERTAFRLIHTLDGTTMLFGEDNTMKLLNHALAERSRELPDSVLVLALNSDVVSRKFTAWVVEVSDYVLLAKSWIKEEGIRETLYFTSAPRENFEPAVYALIPTKSKEKLEIERISP